MCFTCKNKFKEKIHSKIITQCHTFEKEHSCKEESNVIHVRAAVNKGGGTALNDHKALTLFAPREDTYETDWDRRQKIAFKTRAIHILLLSIKWRQGRKHRAGIKWVELPNTWFCFLTLLNSKCANAVRLLAVIAPRTTAAMPQHNNISLNLANPLAIVLKKTACSWVVIPYHH